MRIDAVGSGIVDIIGVETMMRPGITGRVAIVRSPDVELTIMWLEGNLRSNMCATM